MLRYTLAIDSHVANWVIDNTFARKCLKTKKNKPIYYVSGLSNDEIKKATKDTDPKISYIQDKPDDDILGKYVCDHNLPLQFMSACFPFDQKHWKKFSDEDKISDMDPKSYEFLQKVFSKEAKTVCPLDPFSYNC